MKNQIKIISVSFLVLALFFIAACKKDPQDTVAPLIYMNGPATAYWQQNKSYADPGCTANDDKDGTVAVISSGSVNPGVIGVYTINYTAKDAAGNSISTSRTVKVVNFDGKYDLVHTNCTDTSRNTVPTHPDSSIVNASGFSTYYDLKIDNFGRRNGNLVNASFYGESMTVIKQASVTGVGDLIEGVASISGTGIGADKIRLTFHFKERNAADSVFNEGTAVFTHR